MNATYEQCATDWTLWTQYVDTDATMTREEFDALSVEAKIAMQVEAFGPEESGYLSLTDEGQYVVRTTVAAVARNSADPDAWFSDAEQAANNAAPGESIVIEVGRQYSRDGQPHTITLARNLFA